MRNPSLVAGALGLGLVLTACTSATPEEPERVEASAGDVPLASMSPTPDEGSLGTAGETAGTSASRYGPEPLSAYRLSNDDSDVIVRAADQLIAGCMAERGFGYDRGPQAASADWVYEPWADYLGLTDEDRARSDGYWVSTELAREERLILAQDTDVSTSPEDEAYQAALLGGDFPEQIDPDACSPRSSARLVPPGAAPDLDVVGEAQVQAAAQAAADPQVLAARTEWSACMAEHGYVVEDIPLPSGDQERTQEGIDRALTDVGCKNSTGLTGAYITTLYAKQESQIQSHLADLQAFEAWTQERVRLAAEVLGDAP